MHSSATSKERFSSRVDAYVAARPRYPKQVIEHVRREIGINPSWHVVDIGSGRGISCELFLENGNSVTGVEPNAAMPQAAEKALAPFARFRSVNGSAEATTLADHSADLIVSAQAFHWFDVAATRREFMRILCSGGWALLMWNDRKLGGTPFLEAYEKLMITYGTDYLKVRHNNITSTDGQFAEFFGPAGYQSANFANKQQLDFEGLRTRLFSSSYMPQQNDPRFAEMMTALEDIFARHSLEARVTIEYQTKLFYGRFSSRESPT